MNSNRFFWREVRRVAICHVICGAVTCGVFALLKRFDLSVLWGTLAGIAIAVLNYIALAYYANKAADMAENEDVAAGRKLMQLSYTGRMLGIFAALAVCALVGVFNLLALVIPIGIGSSILKALEMYDNRKRGGSPE